jgi:hypothetical protein
LHPRGVAAVILSAFLAVPPAGLGQEKAAPPAKPSAPPGSLKIVVVQGEGAVNSIVGKTATQPVVEVRDQNDKPVAGAEVVFQLPAAGPGGIFHGWMRTQTARTNEQGQAGASGLVPNDQPGRFNIKVTAAQGDRTASVIIAQTNLQRTGSGGRTVASSSWKWKVIGLAGLGAVVGGIYATKRNGVATAATPATPVTITVGAVTVAGPR